MILSRLIADTEFSAQKGGSEFSHEFFHGIGIGAEATREIAIEARWMTAPVHVLMEEDGIEGFGRAARFGSDESGSLRHPDTVSGGLIERAIAAILHFRSNPVDEAFDCFEADGAIFEHGHLILPAIDLSGIEDGGRTDQNATLFRIALLVGITLVFFFLEEENERSPLTLPDMSPELLPLEERPPERGTVVTRPGCRPEGERVETVIRAAGNHVPRETESRTSVPRHHVFSVYV